MYIDMGGLLTRYANLRIAHAPGTFCAAPTSKETAGKRSRHASQHVPGARAVMHVGIAHPRWRGNIPGITGACATRNFAYLVNGPYWSWWHIWQSHRATNRKFRKYPGGTDTQAHAIIVKRTYGSISHICQIIMRTVWMRNSVVGKFLEVRHM